VLIPVLAATVLIGGREARVLPAVDPPEWRRMLRQILPYSAAVILSVLYFRVVQVMMSLLSSDLETGYFGVSFRILESLTTIPPLLASSALPILARAAERDPSRFEYAGRRLAEAMMLGGVGLALVLCLGADFAVDLVAGAAFAPSIDVLRILAIALIGTFVIAARGYALLSLGRLRAMLVCNAIAFAVVVLAGIPLIEAHGATGGAITMVAAELALAVGYEIALTRGQPELRPPLSFVARLALAAAIAVAVVLLAGLPSLPAAVAGAAVFAAAAAALRAVPVELFQAFWPGRSRASEGTTA
jgi:O-antigen/teichoic acid export membrane protein